jgi:hypothetical protein
MSSRARNVAVAVALAIAAVVVGVLALGGDNDETNSPPAAQAPGTTGASGPTNPKPKPIRPRGKRDPVRRGHGTRPDQPAPGSPPLLAIADQKPETFSDPRFRALGVTRSRLNTPWNSIFTEPARLASWLNAARAAGIEPLVAFEHARGEPCPSQPCRLPPVRRYERAVRAFRTRYPWVRLLQPWNEANSATQPTGKHPEAAATYYESVRRICRSCVVTGADVLDSGNLSRWLGRFRSALRGPVPRLWGLHNYTDSNRFRTTGTRRMLSLVPGELWLTEAGGIVSFTTADGRVALPYDEVRAARATTYLLKLSRLSPRIRRTYIYQWKIDFNGQRFDSGLVSPDGNPRPALRVVASHRAQLR